jgi:ribosome-associated protein
MTKKARKGTKKPAAKAKKPAKRVAKAAPRKAKPKSPAAKPRAVKSSAKAPAAKAVHNEILKIVLARLNEEKAANTVKIDLKGKSTIADYMVVTSGRSNRHVNAITDHVVEALRDNGISRVRIEGLPQCDWVLIAAGDVSVHVVRPEARAFYNLQKMWARARPES